MVAVYKNLYFLSGVARKDRGYPIQEPRRPSALRLVAYVLTVHFFFVRQIGAPNNICSSFMNFGYATAFSHSIYVTEYDCGTFLGKINRPAMLRILRYIWAAPSDTFTMQ